MNIIKIISALTALSLLGGSMTSPTFNSADLDLPTAIAETPESPVIARIGVVVDIVESDNITVALSGSPTLVTASYLFPQYQPLLGDRVYIAKQDAQWAVLGTLSGPLNTVLSNPSFEEGTIGSLPTGWSLTVISGAAGNPTFTKQDYLAVSGRYVAAFGVQSAGVMAVSTADVYSPIALATEGQNWALGFYITYVIADVDAVLRSQGGFVDLQAFIQFLDGSGTLVSETSVYYVPFYGAVAAPLYARTNVTGTGAPGVVAPPGTERVRVRFRANFRMDTNSASEIGLDVVLLRSV